MIELLAGLAVGGGVAIASGFVGNIMGFTRGRAERNIAALFTTGQSDALWCTCRHALSFHANGRGCSHTRTQDDGVSLLKDQYGYEHLCACKRFVGDPSRNPAPITTRPQGELDLG